MENIRLEASVVHDILALTQTLVKKYPRRQAGTEGSLQAAAELKNELRNHCDSAVVEDFSQHPGSFYLLPPILAAAYILGTALLFAERIGILAAGVVYFIAAFYIAVEFVFLGTLFDPLFKRRAGRNVIGVLEPAGPAEQQVIICGHHDSALISNFYEKRQKWYALLVITPGILLLLALATAAAAAYSAPSGPFLPRLFPLCRIILLAGTAAFVPLFNYYSRVASPGAGDNMASSAALVGLARLFGGERPRRMLQRTKIVFLSADGEEIGMRGARHFVKTHRKDLLRITTYVFIMDSLYRYDDLALLRTDRNGTIRLSLGLVRECLETAEELGYRIKAVRFPFGGGGTDAARFAQAGLETASLIGISTRIDRTGTVYHTSRDTTDNIEERALAAGLDIIVNWILRKDREDDETATASGGPERV